jgi:predicted dehydrogenase/threonine dehydrogenase-like Zn-dependent dehydrogenase
MAGISSSGNSPVRTILEQPEKVRKILDMIRSEGLGKLIEQYRFLKESGQPTGYSVSGIVIGLGEGVSEFTVGEPVAAAGGGYAYHAEFVEVPKNLIVSIPPGLSFKEASSIALGAIALHAIRRTGLELGEYCVVMGNGILGLIAVQILRLSGIRVISVDIDKNRLRTAFDFGAENIINPHEEDPVKAVQNITGGRGTDAVLFAAATQDSIALSQAFQMCRRKGRVILMGVSGMDLNRKDIYPGELDFRISTSYGPGRYDSNYEEDGIDYPYAYVRWTEGRNLMEYIRLLATKEVSIEPLIHQVYPIEEAGKAFDLLKETGNKPLIVILDYGTPADIAPLPVKRKLDLSTKPLVKGNKINVGVLGIGNFAQSVHLPNLKKLGDKYAIFALASQSGVKAKNAGTFFNARYVTTRYEEIIEDENIHLVMICTRHGNHASLALKALEAGKHVFVEKPLATKPEDLRLLEDFFSKHADNAPLLMVGFNRRFSPSIREIKKYTDTRVGPLFIHYRMNAGYQPADHWTHQDGGRIIGEACHIIDLMSTLTNSKIISCYAENLEAKKGKFLSSDNKSLCLKYEDGSLATVEYISTGSRSLAKEYMEIHFDEKSIIMDDYRQLSSFGFRIRPLTSKISNKGHLQELEVLYNHLMSKRPEWPIAWENLLETTRTTFTIA